MSNEVISGMDATSADQPKGRSFNFKGFTSLFLSLIFTAVALSGAILYLTPRGRTAHWTDWTMLGLGKEEWSTLHINTCAVLLVVSALHLALNWKMFVGYLHKKATGGLNLKREMFAAAGLTGLLLAGTILAWPPFEELADLNTRIKNSWESQMAEAPVPHSEELTLVRFAQQIKLPVEDMTSALATEGFSVDDLEKTVGDVARQKGVAPSAVLAAIRKHHPGVAAAQGRGQGRGMGQGMGRGRGGRGMAPLAGGPELASRSCEDPECSATDGDRLSTDGCETSASDSCADSSCSEGGSDHRPGQGRGMGMGRGMGQGMGRGMGQGMGQGMGRGMGQGMGQGTGRGMGMGRGMGFGGGQGSGDCQHDADDSAAN